MGPENLDRLQSPKMEYYHEVYKNSTRWNGVDDLSNKRVIVYCEQGFGDIIQFSRYFPIIKQMCGELIIHCPKELHRLFSDYTAIDKEEENLPEHDFHVLSMSLPFCLPQTDIKHPYLKVSESTDLSEYNDFIKIGIAWEGNPEHSNNDERSCPLVHFKKLQTDKTKLFMIQKEIHIPELIDGAEDLDLYGSEITDFYDTAKLLNSLDIIVSIDTSVLHLACALGKPTYGLLSYRCDPRWDVDNWYDSLTITRQKSEGDWDGAMSGLIQFLKLKNQWKE